MILTGALPSGVDKGESDVTVSLSSSTHTLNLVVVDSSVVVSVVTTVVVTSVTVVSTNSNIIFRKTLKKTVQKIFIELLI